jgi:hypothetical protein
MHPAQITAIKHGFVYLFTFIEMTTEIFESMTSPLLLLNQHTGTVGKFSIMTFENKDS